MNWTLTIIWIAIGLATIFAIMKIKKYKDGKDEQVISDIVGMSQPSTDKEILESGQNMLKAQDKLEQASSGLNTTSKDKEDLRLIVEEVRKDLREKHIAFMKSLKDADKVLEAIQRISNE